MSEQCCLGREVFFIAQKALKERPSERTRCFESDLSKNGLNINSRDRCGDPYGTWTALHNACRFRSVEEGQFLIEHGADVNIRSNAGQQYNLVAATPLMFALSMRAPGLVQPLIEAKANVRAKCGYKNTALHYALDNSESTGILPLLRAGAKFVPRYEPKVYHKVTPDSIVIIMVKSEATTASELRELLTFAKESSDLLFDGGETSGDDIDYASMDPAYA